MKKVGQPSIFPPSRPVEILAVHVKPWYYCSPDSKKKKKGIYCISRRDKNILFVSFVHQNQT